MTSIVTVLVEQQIAPTPPTLQQSGAIISQGATTISPGAWLLLTELSSLTPYLNGSEALSSISWSAGVVTATAASPHGFEVGIQLYLTVAGASPAGYNGTWYVTITSTTQFTYPLSVNPGTETSPGMYTVEDVNELLQQATSFFSMGYQTAVYVLELGAGSPTEGVAALSAYITQNPNQAYNPGDQGYFYSYLVPRTWDGNSAFLALLPQFSGTTARTYFHITTTLATYGLYSDLWKAAITYIEAYATGTWPANTITAATWSSGVVTFNTTTAHGVAVGQWFQIVGMVPAGYNGYYQATVGTSSNTLVANLATNPGTETTLGSLVASTIAYSGVAATEFTAAYAWWVTLTWAPSSANRVPPWSYVFLPSATPFPKRNNSSLLALLKTANVNVVLTGSEGGISTPALFYGKNMDGNPFNYWYGVDWFAINSDINIANAIFNGSNTSIAPLYYNQDGINQLQAVIQSTAASAVTFGLGAGQVVITNLSGPAFALAIANGTYAGQIVINAVPFTTYLAASPGDYKLQQYLGFSASYIPLLGFLAITFTIVVTEFVSGPG